MNKVFLTGSIVSEIEFDFIYGEKRKISIIRLKIKLDNNSKVDCIGYNEIADYLYRSKKKEDTIILEGKIISRNESRNKGSIGLIV